MINHGYFTSNQHTFLCFIHLSQVGIFSVTFKGVWMFVIKKLTQCVINSNIDWHSEWGGGGGRVCVSKGKALGRGTKCRAGGGYGRVVSPLPKLKKIEIRDCLDVFWSTPNSTLLYPRNLKFRGYYGFGPDAVSAAAAARQGLCFT